MSKQKHTPDSLADRLDDVLPPDTQAQPQADPDPLVEAASHIARAPRPALPPDVMARIQSQVLQHYEQQIQAPAQPAPAAPRVIRLHPALRWALVASLVIVVLFTASIPPALASVPGDVLYPVKQAVEQVELGLATSPQAQATAYLNFAERRTQELDTLLQRGTLDTALVDSALANMIEAADRARSGGADVTLVQTRTVAITARLNGVLQAAAIQNPDDNDSAHNLLSAAQATQASGALLLPASPQPTTAPTQNPPTDSPTLTPEPTDTTAAPTETALTSTPVTPEQTATPEPTLTTTPTELPTNLVIEGPIEAINGNIIIIYGIEIEIPADDPLLGVLRVGDVIRVDGSIQSGVTQVNVDAIGLETINVDTAVNPDNSSEIWRDSGDCTNPPPPWAPANGWRARCGGGGQVSPPGNSGGNSGNNNSGGNSGNSGRGNQGQGQGQGQGRGNNDDDD